jgi:hypothetical protein
VGQELGEIWAARLGKPPILIVARFSRVLTWEIQSRESREWVAQAKLRRGKIFDRCTHRLENSDLIVRSVNRVTAGQISQFRHDL